MKCAKTIKSFKFDKFADTIFNLPVDTRYTPDSCIAIHESTIAQPYSAVVFTTIT